MSNPLLSLFKHRFFDRLGIILVGTLLSGTLLYLAYQLLKAPVQAEDLQMVAGTLSEEAVLSPRRRHSTASITLKLKEFPALYFTASRATNNAMYTEEFVRDVHRGDSVRIWIIKEDYRERIIRGESPSVFSNFVSGGHIDLYGVVSKGSTYLHPDDRQTTSKRDHLFLFIVLIFLSILLFSDIKTTWGKAFGKRRHR